MKVALGTIEIEDEHRKAIRKALGGKGQATRGEVKDFLLQALNDDVLPNVGQEASGSQGQDDGGSVAMVQADRNAETESSDEPLPEPGSSDTASNTTSSAPATGTGSTGTSGGTTGGDSSGGAGMGYGTGATSSAPSTGNAANTGTSA